MPTVEQLEAEFAACSYLLPGERIDLGFICGHSSDGVSEDLLVHRTALNVFCPKIFDGLHLSGSLVQRLRHHDDFLPKLVYR